MRLVIKTFLAVNHLGKQDSVLHRSVELCHQNYLSEKEVAVTNCNHTTTVLSQAGGLFLQQQCITNGIQTIAK